MQHADALQPNTYPSLDEASFAIVDHDMLLSPQISSHAPRILLLYGSLRPRSFSRLAAEKPGRILTRFGAKGRFF